ncbi:PREDICTED: sodium- and chloride-dependent glycine transporter 2-like [Priapulus caudatus]|uniref:Sodium- and chloride-dependent glycine transporter 2-like n=1 Tax=Priapulus caudatus TaxID=37621 RepID=A0ABM1EY69_PRICU|nr:PREDICTED: sodium- and chloride-dependent glycine transporter 2-like [Priapulus caudatus]
MRGLMLNLGLDATFADVQTMSTMVFDEFPNTRRWKPLVVGVIVVAMYVLGLPMCTGAGLYWIDLMNIYATCWSLILVGLLESIVVAWVYGARRFLADLSMMIGSNIGYSILNSYWFFTWCITAPLLVLGIFIFNFLEYETPMSQGILYPKWAEVLGWVMAFGTLAPVLIVGAVNAFRFATDRIQTIVRPDPTWGPALDRFRTGDYAPIGHQLITDGESHLYNIDDLSGHPGVYRPHLSDELPQALLCSLDSSQVVTVV